MIRASVAGCVAATLAMAGCAASAPSRADDPAALARRIAVTTREVQIVYLGESHDNPYHHMGQARVLEAMLAEGGRPALALEMLTEDQQPVVDEAMGDGSDPAAVGKRLAWTERGWPDFEMYRPLFDQARRYGLPVVAIDLGRQTARRIAKEGLTALSAEERSRLVSRLAPDARRERDIARDIEAAHCDLLPASAVARMVHAWHARNLTMARRILEALERAPQVVVIVGRGHQAPGGLADQVQALRPGTSQLAVDFVEVGHVEPAQAPSANHVIWPTPSVERPDPCAPLRSR